MASHVAVCQATSALAGCQCAAGVPATACKCTPTCLASLHLATAAACPQAAEKLVLAEGSKMAVAAFQGSHDQGVYGVRHWTAVNRGGRGWVDRSRDAVQRRGVHRHAAAHSALHKLF